MAYTDNEGMSEREKLQLARRNSLMGALQNSFQPQRQARTTRVSQLGRIGSPAQETIFQQGEQGEQNALANALAQLAGEEIQSQDRYDAMQEQKDQFNRKMAYDEAILKRSNKKAKKAALGKALLSTAGGIAGGLATGGSPAGWAAGAQVGSAIGGGAGELLGYYS